MLITVPDLEKQKLDLPRRLPPDAPRDCIMTYERLCALHRRMTSMNQYEKNASQYDVEEEEEEGMSYSSYRFFFIIIFPF